jgi:general secretion pathway protein L
VVLGARRGLLVDVGGAGTAFDRGAGGELPLALHIALDEASARGARPRVVRVHTEGEAALPDLERWSAEAGVGLERGTRWEVLARGEPGAGTIDLLPRDANPTRLARLRIPRAAVALLAAIVVAQLAFDAARTWTLSRERAALEQRAGSLFRGAFPEAKAVVDPRLQMERNLAGLRRSRGLAGGDDFLARLTAEARESSQPVRAIEYANGKLVVHRGAPPEREAKR